MSIFHKRNKQNIKPQEERSFADALNFNTLSSFGGVVSGGAALKLSAVYRAVDLISDSIAMLPLEVQYIDNDGYKQKFTDHSAFSLVNAQPNPIMTRFQFIKLLVSNVLLNGNGFAYIKRDRQGNATELQYLRADNVVIFYNELTGQLNYMTAAVPGYIEPCNMIHILKYSNNGVNGISVLHHAANTLGLAYDTEQQARTFFKNGCNLSGLINSTTPLSGKQKQDIKSAWNQSYNGMGGGVPILEGNLSYQPVSISSKDAQLLESRNFNLTDIARFFGVSPVMLGDLTNSSYSTLEATQLAFLSQCLQPWLELIEQEFTRKLFRPSEQNLSVNFDDSKLIKTDKAALATWYQQLFNISAITPNEIRKEIGLTSIEGGDKTFMQLNMSTLENIGQNNTEK